MCTRLNLLLAVFFPRLLQLFLYLVSWWGRVPQSSGKIITTWYNPNQFICSTVCSFVVFYSEKMAVLIILPKLFWKWQPVSASCFSWNFFKYMHGYTLVYVLQALKFRKSWSLLCIYSKCLPAVRRAVEHHYQ